MNLVYRPLGRPRLIVGWLLMLALMIAAGPACSETDALSASATAEGGPLSKIGGAPIPVRIGLELNQITSIDQKAENFSAVVTLRMRYEDPALAYEPDADGDAFRMYRIESFLKLAEDKGTRWPEPALINQQGRKDFTARTVVLSPQGTVRFYSRFTTTFQAPDFDFRRFPFDHQEFYIRVVSLLPERFFRFETLQDASGVGDQLGEEEWVVYDHAVEVRTTSGETGLPSSELVLSFKAHRHLMYYAVRIFIPMLIILLVSWFTFQLKDYVKRIDVGITTLLLFIAFNFTVSSDLPRLGYITAMDAFMTGAFVITGIVLLVNVYLRRLQTVGQEARAARLDRYAIWGYWPGYIIGTSVALLLL